MGDLFNIASEEFWLGIVGAFFVTGYLTEVLKFILEKFMKKGIPGEWKPVIAIPAGFIIAILNQLAMVARHNLSLSEDEIAINFSWYIVGALTIIYAAASSWVYRWIIKKLEVPSIVDKKD